MPHNETSLVVGAQQPPRVFAHLPAVLSATGRGRSTTYRLIADSKPT